MIPPNTLPTKYTGNPTQNPAVPPVPVGNNGDVIKLDVVAVAVTSNMPGYAIVTIAVLVTAPVQHDNPATLIVCGFNINVVPPTVAEIVKSD